jgi:hypothetical protein
MIADLNPRDLDDLLSRALAVDLTTEARERIRARLEGAVAAPAARRPPRRRTVVVLGLAASLLVAGTVTGVHYLGEWGPVDHPATVAEIEAEINSAMAEDARPPGYTYPVAQIRANAEMEGGRAQHVGTLAVQQRYMCAWTDYWLAGNRSGHKSQMAEALPAIVAFPKLMLIGDPRFAADSIRDEIKLVVAGAKAGDAGPVQELWDAACSDAMLVRP